MPERFTSRFGACISTTPGRASPEAAGTRGDSGEELTFVGNGVESDLVVEMVKTAIASRVVIEEELGGRRMVFDPALDRAESRLASSLAKLADEAPRWHDIDPEEAVAIAEAESGIPLDATQRAGSRERVSRAA